MNIYDKFPITFIRWAVNNGMQLELNKDYIDLNTGMKSQCHLFYEDGKYLAKCRYDTIYTIDTFYDLYSAVRDCEHGKGFMNGGIIELYENGFGELDWQEFC